MACIAAVIIMIVALCMPKKTEQKPFIPPSFDENATQGEPIVPDDLGYSILYRDGMSFKVGICGKINVTNNSADVYLTNISENNVWLKVRFYDQAGNALGESGLLKPGEYLQSVALDHISDTNSVTVKVMSYEPDTYRSMGTITLTPKISMVTQ